MGVGGKLCQAVVALAFASASLIWGAPFGTVVPVLGHVSDLALDQSRGVIYLANYTGNRIEVISLATLAPVKNFSVADQPNSIALSPDGRYLVATHYSPLITILDLTTEQKRTLVPSGQPLTVAFGKNGIALIATTSNFLLLDPAAGSIRTLTPVSAITAELGVAPGTFPPQITEASSAASADGNWIVGIAAIKGSGGSGNASGGSDIFVMFTYQTANASIQPATWTASPPLGPRAVSVAKDGSSFLAGWGLFTRSGVLTAQWRNASGLYGIGSHALDLNRQTIYAQFPEQASAGTSQSGGSPAATLGAPVLLVLDADNLTQREKLQLAENLTGRSVLSADGNTMYSASESGMTVLPVGALANAHRLAAYDTSGQPLEDILFRSTFCDRHRIVQQIRIQDPGGNATDFTLVPSMPGVTVSPARGTTPATVEVSVDPSVFENLQGTQVATIEIQSASAVNMALPVRVLFNNREPDQRGTIFNVAGKLVDMIPDPVRHQFYVLRQDRNQVLVFDSGNLTKKATLRTGNTPTRMAISVDGAYLLVGNDDSQIANVYNLETLQQEAPIVFPAGHYPRSIACSNNAVLAASRVVGPKHTIDRVNMGLRTATTPAQLGIFENNIDVNTVLASSPAGARILIAQPNGKLMLYDATSNTFPIGRDESTTLKGAFGALSDSLFVAGDSVLNSVLMSVQQFDTTGGATSGVTMFDEYALRAAAGLSSGPGTLQKVSLGQPLSLLPTRTVEAPLLGTEAAPFIRTIATLPDRNGVVMLSVSGFTVLSRDYDAAVASPAIDAVVSAADWTRPAAAGGLITITGRQLSPVNAATSQIPLPTALAESCVTVNGTLIPLLYVSDTQINAQLPFGISSSATAVLHTPAGISNSLDFSVAQAAPAVFLVPVEGWDALQPAIIRNSNGSIVTLSNPVHPKEWIVIYATGLGATQPGVDAGWAGPLWPLANVVQPPSLSMGGMPLEVGYAGLAPGMVGVYQINAYVPWNVPEGMQVPIRIAQGGVETVLNVRVVR